MLKREVGVCHVQWLLPFFLKLKTALCTSSMAVGITLKHSMPFSLSLSLTHFFLIIFLKILKLKFQLFN